MTKKAIELLSQDEDGFFLMVEGSKIDWAAHSNDPVALVSDCLAFDKAVGVALDFAKQNGETVVIAATDHGTGGISIGNSATSSTYDEIPLNDIIAPLKKATLTGEGLEKVMAPDRNNAVEVLAKYYGLSNLTSDEIEAVKENTYYGYLGYTVGPMLAQHCGIGFTTGRHTGEDVTLYVYAPRGVDQLTGTVENTDIARYMEILMGLSLDDTTKKLFVPARKAFEAQGAKVEFDTTDKKNPVLTVTRGETIIKMPVHTNIAYVNGAAAELEGVVVFDGVGTTYVPQGALELLQ
jgi:alkaline phosphatase